MDLPSQRERVLLDWIIIILFLLFIIFPEINRQLLLIPDIPSTEQRTLAPRPVFDNETFDEYIKKFDLFYNDHFGFRIRLVAANTWLHVKLFGIFGRWGIIIGKNGWLFFSEHEQANRNALSGWQGYNPYSLKELSAIQSNLEAENMWFNKQNISFLIFPSPDKNSIYPEYLPWPYNTKVGPSRQAQIFEHMKLHSNVELVDVRQPLFTAKELNQLYTFFKTDTHWNNFGAFIAYQEIMERLLTVYPQFIPYSLEDFYLDRNLKRTGDMARMGQFDVSNLLEHQLVLKPNVTNNKTGPKLAKLLIFGDSFSEFFFKDYLSLHFNEILFIYGVRSATTVFDKTFILNYRPNVVIFESVERFWTRALNIST